MFKERNKISQSETLSKIEDSYVFFLKIAKLGQELADFGLQINIQLLSYLHLMQTVVQPPQTHLSIIKNDIFAR